MGHLEAETPHPPFPPAVHPLDARPWTHPTPRPPPVRPPAPVAPRSTPGHRPFSVSGIEVAVLGYGMMSMYWCCRLSIESGCRSVSPKEETSRNPAIGGAYGLWQAEGSVRHTAGHTAVPDPLPPHPMARTQNNNPIQTTAGITNTCSFIP